jgi:hypothetical protein
VLHSDRLLLLFTVFDNSTFAAFARF